MGLVERTTTVASILTRLAAYLLLQVIPGSHASKCYYFFVVYLAGFVYVQRELSLVENEPHETMKIHQQRQEEHDSSKLATPRKNAQNGHSAPSSPASPSALRKSNLSYADAVKEESPTTTPKQSKPPKAISYADVAKGKHPQSPPEYETAKASLDSTESHGDKLETYRPPTAHLARSMSIPTRPNPWHLLTGAPSSSRSFNLFSLLFNVAMILMCLDFQLTPLLFLPAHDTTFIRVGAIAHDSVKLVARLPPYVYTRHNGTSSSLLPKGTKRQRRGIYETLAQPEGVRVVYRPTRPAGPWHYAGLLAPGNESDYVGVLELHNLRPSTEYEYALALPPVGHKSTLLGLSHAKGTPADDLDPDGVHYVHPSIHSPQYFRTSPDPRLSRGNTHYTFAASSCIKPGWPYVPGGDHFAIPGASDLAERISPDNIEFLMFMGDFQYMDSPPHARTNSQYMQKYRQVYASKDYRRIYERIPTMHIYDDHEIINDFAGQGNDSDPAFELANPPFVSYLGAGNPTPSFPGRNYYDFVYGDSAFFVWDTRRYRSRNEDIDDAEKTMLGQDQKDEFLNWLSRVNQTVTWKFIVSSVPFMTLWGGPNGQLDTWGGFQTERTELMDVMEYVPNIIVISGDRHEFAAAIIRDSVIDLSISPLQQFTLPLRTLSPNTGLGATGEDVLLKYLPDGKRKFGVFEVDSRTVNQPVVSFKLYIDGKKAWNMDIIGQPVLASRADVPDTTIGRLLSQSWSEILGFGKRWF